MSTSDTHVPPFFTDNDYSIAIITLGVYSVVTTFVITALTIYVYKLRRCQGNKVVPRDPSEELLKSHRISKPNSYEVEFPSHDVGIDGKNDTTPSLPKGKIHRSRSVPLRPTKYKILNQHDPQNFVPKTRQLPEIPGSSRWSEQKYEEMDVPTGHPYNGIISNVVESLSQIYFEEDTENDIQQRFLKQLLKTMKMKNMPLYESLQKCALSERHDYEEIDETREQVSTSKQYQYKECQSDSESTYATYVPNERDKKRYQLLKSTDNGKFKRSFGSCDHLRYFKENKLSKTSSASDSPYLKPKIFLPTSDCPPHLQRLCEDSAYNTMEKSSNKNRSNSDTYRPEVESRPEVPPKPKKKVRSYSECEEDKFL